MEPVCPTASLSSMATVPVGQYQHFLEPLTSCSTAGADVKRQMAVGFGFGGIDLVGCS